MYKLWLEWDFGQDDFIFHSEEDARDWMEKNIDLQGELQDEFENYQGIFDAGLASIKKIEVYNLRPPKKRKKDDEAWKDFAQHILDLPQEDRHLDNIEKIMYDLEANIDIPHYEEFFWTALAEQLLR